MIMNNFYFGILIGVFLCFAGQRFIVWLVKTIKERRQQNKIRLVEIVNEIVNRGE
jgi:hypothetical protein